MAQPLPSPVSRLPTPQPRVRREASSHASELISRFEIAKINARELSRAETKELQRAEELAKRFIGWDIDEETQDVMDILKDMIDAVYGDEDSDGEDERQDEANDDAKRSTGDVLEARVEEMDDGADMLPEPQDLQSENGSAPEAQQNESPTWTQEQHHGQDCEQDGVEGGPQDDGYVDGQTQAYRGLGSSETGKGGSFRLPLLGLGHSA